MADMWEQYLLSLSDKDWKEYAEKQGWIAADVVVAEDGTVTSPKPELSEFFRNFEQMYGDQGFGPNSGG